ncbi:MAG: serine/threonine protein kinase, partial [Myxococcaceae bacterium]|nr:serine/threonine protein kinase [Myxococcaceae bacterium]
MTVAAAQRDRYRVLNPIGSGGMSQVFEAFDESLRRTVALKVLHPHLALDPEARARFAREAQATARLRHPNIVEIFDVAALDSNDAFIVTELIHGPTLSAFVAAHPLAPPGELAFLVMHQLACALAHAHQNDVVHRDLKPENVMLSESGGLKLMDFGIARILDSQTRMTMTGTLVGSPLHMAPEIIEGERATPASDIFSAGTILYWLVSGAPPFLGNKATQTLRKILDVERED